MPDLHSINKSRIGSSYQYKFSLFLILKNLIDGKLEEAHVDFPFEHETVKSLSLDLKLKLIQDTGLYIYEIKTGDDFKDSQTEELKKVFRNLYYFEKTHGSPTNKNIVFSPNTTTCLMQHWNDILFIQSRKRRNNRGETRQSVQQRLFGVFGVIDSGLSSEQFSNYLKMLNFQEGPDYSNDRPNDDLTDLEDGIKSEIDNFCAKLEIQSTETELPSWSIATELLDVLNKCAENNQEVVVKLSNKLFESLCRRRLIQEATYTDGDKGRVLRDLKQGFKKQFVDLIKINLEDTITITHE